MPGWTSVLDMLCAPSVGRRERFASRMPTHQNRCMGHPHLCSHLELVVVQPMSQNRDMGHPELWLTGAHLTFPWGVGFVLACSAGEGAGGAAVVAADFAGG